ncbi:hypothetical protein GBA65_02675 [Rubrobacter marinus]|uniref:Uncharacterized protein n=1 Tax=Rubrobacter marinus TaxID=2653852 RepID=A0A6G8PUR6_9ACTN|nr:hypothetical protein [Rubrobacter marinus]QIN77595.1 hypothetical protein GBA65_02675 [Rubrobacter marinus]
MPSGTGERPRATSRRGRTTVLVVSLAAFAAGAGAMLLGHEEALGLMVLALLAAASEVVSEAVRSSRGEGPRGGGR